MSDLGGPRLARWRLIERLVELAAEPEEQLSYLSGQAPFLSMWQKIHDLAIDFWEWSDGLPAMVRAGVVPAKAEEAVLVAVDHVRVLDEAARQELEIAADVVYTPEALRRDSRWDDLRNSAKAALEAFRLLGLPIPSLSDPDFNQPREDAP
jgi:hypothetical protein